VTRPELRYAHDYSVRLAFEAMFRDVRVRLRRASPPVASVTDAATNAACGIIRRERFADFNAGWNRARSAESLSEARAWAGRGPRWRGTHRECIAHARTMRTKHPEHWARLP
jgi:hypothetical protein